MSGNKSNKIEFICTDCGNSYYVRPLDVSKRKTTLCRACVLRRRNRTSRMREVSRKNGSLPKSAETRRKLALAQHKHWTQERRAKRSGEENPAWVGGKTLSSGGYIYTRCPGHPRATQKGNYVFEHILVMEGHLGRHLNDSEVVHHINGDKTDNRIENLDLCASSSVHISKYHGSKK